MGKVGENWGKDIPAWQDYQDGAGRSPSKAWRAGWGQVACWGAVQVWVPGPLGSSCTQAPGTPLWRIVPVTRKGWHQLVECAWGGNSVFGFKVLFLLCFVSSKLYF